MSDLYNLDFGSSGGFGLQPPSSWSTPSTSSFSTPDYSFGAGSGTGIQAGVNTSWTPSSGGDWFSSGGGTGLRPPSVDMNWSSNWLNGSGGGTGLQPPSGVFDSWGGGVGGGGSWWDFGSPAGGSQPSWSTSYSPTFGGGFGGGFGMGSGVSVGQGQTNFGITSGTGLGPQQGVGLNPGITSGPGLSTGTAGATGAFGVDAQTLMTGQNQLGLRAPALLDWGSGGGGDGAQGTGEFSMGSAAGTQGNSPEFGESARGTGGGLQAPPQQQQQQQQQQPQQDGDTSSGPNAIESRLRQVSDWGKENPLLARGGAALAQYLLAREQQRGPNRLANEELNMRREQYRQQMEDRERMMGQQEEARQMAMAMAQRNQAMQQRAMATQMSAMRRNNALADRHNAQSQQSFDEARSLYNPQELGIRGMASQKAATQRGVEDIRQQMQRRGMSPAAIEAEVRRARLGGSTGGVTAYMAGLDTGRTGMQSALGAAKGLSSPYSGVNYSGQNVPIPTVNPGAVGSPGMLDLVGGAANQGAAGTAVLNDLLRWYLNDPSRTESDRRSALEESRK